MKINKGKFKSKWLIIGTCLSGIVATGIVVPLVLSSFRNVSYNETIENNGFNINVPSNQHVIEENNLKYLVDDKNQTASVIGFSDKKIDNSHELSIPGYISLNNQFYAVTSVINGAFYNCNLTSVSFPETLKQIGANAFANNELTELNLPSSLISLGNNSFSNNWFPVGTVINLPSQCNWNKIAALSPFTVTYNLGQFTPGVRTIIQNLAVYQYDSISNNWNIVSYEPSIAIGQKDNVKQNNNIFTYRPNDDLKEPNGVHYTYHPQVVPTNSSVDTTRIIFKTSNGKWYLGTMSFVDNKINFSTKNNYLNGVKFSVFSNNQGKYLFNGDLSNKINDLSISYGDVISFYSNPSATDIIMSTHVPNNVVISSNNFSNYGMYYQISHTSTWREGLPTSFIATPDGFIPYQNIINIQANSLTKKENSTDIFINGVALSDHKITIEYDGKKIETTSNESGEFTFSVPANIALNTLVTISCDGCLPQTFKLIGKNPIKSSFLFKIGNNEFGICPNGYTKKFDLWNSSSTTMPDYNNPALNVNSAYCNSNIKWNDGLANNSIIITNSVYGNDNELKNKYSETINLKSITSSSQLQEALNKISYDPDCTNIFTITIPNKSNYLFGVVSNNNMINVGEPIPSIISNLSGIYDEYSFTITNKGISSNAKFSNAQLGASKTWDATNYMIVTHTEDAGLEVNKFASNWYDPTPLMWETVRNITSNLQTSYDKAIALCQWVSENMHYSDNYSYYHNISETFNHLSGVCGNYAALLAVMCQMSGIVSRVVIGRSEGGPNYFSKFNIVDHAWTQIWDQQMGAWITLDPTWNWYSPYGQIQNALNIGRSDEHICLVLWPTGTNYFSYFAGREYEALNNLGTYYGIQQGSRTNIYPAQYAINLTYLLDKASKLQENEYLYVGNFR